MKQSATVSEQAAALDVFIKLMRATESVSSDVHRAISASGLSVSQFGILEALYHRGEMSQTELAGKILKSAGNITMVINNLEKRGLAVRKRCTEDKRTCIIRLTPRGESLIANIFPAHAERIRRRMAALSVGELKRLGDLLKKLGRTSTKSDSKLTAHHLKQKKQKEL